LTLATHEIYLKRMIKNCSTKRNFGFTLIELLVVISIISILAGAVLLVINPTLMQRKAKETVLKAKTSQLCLALNACGAARDNASLCDTEIELGVPSLATLLDPPTATYTLVPSPATSPNDTIAITGNYITGGTTCIYDCNFNFSDGSIKTLTKGANCL